MASNTKYQPAPQRDSFEEQGSYSQAPPAYQAPQQPDENDSILGAPREEDDNLPDDFKVICDGLPLSMYHG